MPRRDLAWYCVAVLGAVLARYGIVLVAWWPAIVAGLVVVAGWVYAPVRERVARVPHLRWIALGLLIAGALVGAWRLLWFADDALISLHYARNWIEGHGLVFNPGERVEGYTNFLWLAMIAACGRLGLDLPIATLVLGLAAYVATIVLADHVVRKLSGQRLVASFASVMTALSYPMMSFATGGLETVFCALLVLGMMFAAHEDRLLLSGTLGIFATMTHPDHALFYAVIAGVVFVPRLVQRRPFVRDLARYAAPFVVIYVPYFLIRWRYYGDAMPNTFYAKSGGGTYYSQGLAYLFISALVAGALGVLPAFVVGARHLRHTLFVRIVLVAVPVYLFYVARIGGDFMTGRLIVPVLPLVFVIAELGVRSVKRARVAAVLAVPFVLACLPTRVHPAQTERWFMTDERTFWRVASLDPLALRGDTAEHAEILGRYFGAAKVRPVYAAFEIGFVGWQTRFRIVDMHGLIDRELARTPLTERGRPGHEREATAEYVIARGADLARKPLYGMPHAQLAVLKLDGHNYHLAKFREELLAEVRGKPGVELTEMPAYLDAYAARAASIPEAELAVDLAFFDAYYFSVNPDPVRRANILAARR
ncbi:MAG: hypothetical protein WKG01_14950 [Kofleriaceae bacterium]